MCGAFLFSSRYETGYPMYDLLFEKALRTAAIAHKQQTRKGSEIPYIYHPFAVSTLLMRYQYPNDWCIAALLHDTLEDTDIDEAYLEKEFGDRILQLVKSCSEPNHDTASWEKRKEHTIQFLRSAPLPVKIISCADKLHNLHSIVYDMHEIGDQLWARFNRGKSQQQWYHQNIASSLKENVTPLSDHPILNEYEHIISKVFSP